MSQKNYDVVKGIAQAAANAYDGATDENGEPIKIGLKRETGHPVLDSRTMDGFKVKINGNQLVLTYQADTKLKEVAANGYESELEQTMTDIVSFLKKQYRKITGNSLSLKADGEVDAFVQSTSRHRVFVTANKSYTIGSLENGEANLPPSEDRLDQTFKTFLQAGGLGKRAKNDSRKG